MIGSVAGYARFGKWTCRPLMGGVTDAKVASGEGCTGALPALQTAPGVSRRGTRGSGIEASAGGRLPWSGTRAASPALVCPESRLEGGRGFPHRLPPRLQEPGRCWGAAPLDGRGGRCSRAGGCRQIRRCTDARLLARHEPIPEQSGRRGPASSGPISKWIYYGRSNLAILGAGEPSNGHDAPDRRTLWKPLPSLLVWLSSVWRPCAGESTAATARTARSGSVAGSGVASVPAPQRAEG